MNLTLSHEDMLMLLLKGAWFDTVTLPRGVAMQLKEQAGDLIHIEESTLTTPQPFCNLWTKEGWENEMKRRLYILSIKEPKHTHWMPEEKERPPETLESLQKQLTKAAQNGDMNLMMELTTKIETYTK